MFYPDSSRGPLVNNMENFTVDYKWQNDALCATFDIKWFYPAHGKKYPPEVAEACKACPVKKHCLDHALRYEEYGYWAGTTPLQRIAMRKEKGIKLESIFSESEKIVKEEIAKHAEVIQKQKKKTGRRLKSLTTDYANASISNIAYKE